MQKYFFDFDGTLVDSKKRVYTLFRKIVLAMRPGDENLIPDFNTYWYYKRNFMNQSMLLQFFMKFTSTEVQMFKNRWLDEIEEFELLKLDTPFEGIKDVLELLSGNSDLILVSARQFSDRLIAQLNWLDWRKYFSLVLVTNQLRSKDSIIRDTVDFSCDDFFFGDTGEDIDAAKSLGIRSIAVDTGFIALDRLQKHLPWRCANSVYHYFMLNN
ncbi:MAG TPA: HAD hydrolase-like protein [Desulfovibrio sp.]|uniref:HAD family hydrolase n=1 Tax=Desulfovibrio sp. TaxID=885 RepID=UPI002D5D8338|nr:HAD hydrolase-like protein [Desulfovibrio sp.]HZF62231.1 HAD hydrolase-like protein [Desulfovibrio sp.]